MLGQALGATDVSFLIADFSGGALIRLGQAPERTGSTRRLGDETAVTVPVADSPQGRALSTQSVVMEPEGEGCGMRVVAPVTNRGEAIGVLELCLPQPPDEATMDDVALAAHALAYVIIANRRFTDLYEWGQRSIPLSLAAEIQHRLLPGAYTCEGGQFTVAGWLEPAGDVGGDTFDFSIARDALHLSMTDAMGHTVEAAVLASVLVGGLRNARRAGAGLAEQTRLANAGLADHATRGGFVTGQVAHVDLASGRARIVNAGHPAPFRLRDGRVDRVALEADPPFGPVRDQEFRVQELPLEPGDRLLFVTDGVLERDAGRLDVEALVLEGGAMHAREAVQHLIQAILDATGGSLEDDATVLCLDWHGGGDSARTTNGGANA